MASGPPQSPKGSRPTSAAIEDKQSLHPGRALCYYWKKEHREKLEKMVEEGRIRYNTGLEIHIEFCTAQRPSMSLRASYKGCQTIKTALEKAKSNGAEVNRYVHNFEMLRDEVMEYMAVDKNTREDMWQVTVVANNPQRALGPRNLNESLRRPRLGSFEIILVWEDAVEGRLNEVVLFSKLNTLRFPNPPDVVSFLLSVLSPARQTKFKMVVRSAATGESVRGALVRAEDVNGARFYPDRSASVGPRTGGADMGMSVGGGDRVWFHGLELTLSEVARTSGDRYGGVELTLPFAAFSALAQGPLSGGSGPAQHPVQPTSIEDCEAAPKGHLSFFVHGDLPKSVCVPVVPPLTESEIWLVMTWGEFPHTVHLYVRTPEGILSPVARETANGKVEVVHKEGGYGPITVQLRNNLLDGRYHVFARCESYALGNKQIAWPESNAQVSVYGSEAYTWDGPDFFCCPKAGAGPWWDVCFLEVSKGGRAVKVTKFDTLQSDEPGFRPVTIRVLDLSGQPVSGVAVRAVPTNVAYREHTESGETDGTGTMKRVMAMGHYTLTAERTDFLAAAMTLAVDLEAYCNVCTVVMVRPTDFQSSEDDAPWDRLLVLAWGGPGEARLHAETPGRIIKRGEPGGTAGRMYIMGTCPVSVVLTGPQWGEVADEEGAEEVELVPVKDRIYVSYHDRGTPMECANMHLFVYNRKGVEYTVSPPQAGPAKASRSGPEYWDVGFMEYIAPNHVPIFKDLNKRTWSEPVKVFGHIPLPAVDRH